VAVDVKTMDVKKTQLAVPANANTTEASTASRQWQGFLGDIKSEFKKITWTSPEELISYTKIVVIATFVLGMGIYLIDLAIQLCLASLEFVLRLIGG
jgi:preprotein translocase subunit SecE